MSLEDAQSTLSLASTVTNVLLSVLTAIGATKLIKWIIDKKGLTEASKALSGITSTLGFFAGFASVLVGIYETIQGIFSIINWDETTTGLQKVADVARVVFGVIAAIAGVLAMIKAGTVAGGILAGIAVAATIASIVSSIGSESERLKGFANGGSFNTADMFYANENGKTELVASTNSGGAVMNMEQLQSAIYNGMILAMADSGSKEITLKVDQNTLGRVVAQSAGFISETNRRNSGVEISLE